MMQPKKMPDFFFKEDAQQIRVDQFIAQKLSNFSRSYIQKLIQNKFVKVNGKFFKVSNKLEIGDHVQIEIPPL